MLLCGVGIFLCIKLFGLPEGYGYILSQYF
jgi:hypothetical protein